jgi:hypothetical protein
MGPHVHAVWPEWANSNTWAVFFNINQTINIGTFNITYTHRYGYH